MLAAMRICRRLIALYVDHKRMAPERFLRGRRHQSSQAIFAAVVVAPLRSAEDRRKVAARIEYLELGSPATDMPP